MTKANRAKTATTARKPKVKANRRRCPLLRKGEESVSGIGEDVFVSKIGGPLRRRF
jgi:hypothetical protein